MAEWDEVPRGIGSAMVTLWRLLSRYRFKIPPHQRVFGWTEVNVDCLIEDLRVATSQGYPYFFLGTLIVSADAEAYAVIDGQQRLITLTVVLAYLRDRTQDRELAQSLQAMIAAPASGGPAPRLLMREADRQFFRDWVQNPSRIDALIEAPEPEVRPQALIRSAAVAIASAFDELTLVERDQIARFLLGKVSFNLIETADLDGAQSIYQTMDYNKLGHGASAIIKGQLLNAANLSDAEANRIGGEWDEMEDDLGERGVQEFWAAVESIMLGDKPSDYRGPRLLEQRFIQRVDVAKFLREEFPRYLAMWRAVRSCEVDVGEASAEVNRRIACMHLYTNERAWVACAVAILADHQASPTFYLRYFLGLECVTFACLMGAVKGPSKSSRFVRILNAGANETALFGGGGALTMTPQQRNALFSKLNGKLMPDDARAKIAALRLNAALPGGAPLRPGDNVTLEHVLPQSDTEYWRKRFPDEKEREELRYFLGNFVLLTKAQNNLAADKDWESKRQIYFKTRRAPLRALTAEMEHHKEWTPGALLMRHELLVRKLCQDLGILPADR